MLQKELAKRLRARYDTKMDGNEWLEVSSDGIPLCRILLARLRLTFYSLICGRYCRKALVMKWPQDSESIWAMC